MIAQILSRSFLELWLDPVHQALRDLEEESGDPDGDYAYALEGLREVIDVGLQGQLEDEGAVEGDESALDEYSFFSRGPLMSLLQSAIEERIEEAHPELIVPTSEGLDRGGEEPVFCDRRLELPDELGATNSGIFRRFGKWDFRWVAEFGLAKALRAYRGRYPFNPEPARVELAPRARIVMVGDWGSGLPGAQRVAGLMREKIEEGIGADLQVHVIHLGDVYYAGFEREYRERFLPYWPVNSDETGTVFSWSLNGNHDMYSGGHAYFNVLLGDPRFANQAASSWFSMTNEHWRIVGLDTAWDEEGLVHDPRIDRGLADPQAETVQGWAEEDQRPFMLLSHHPLFSAYQRTGPYLSNRLAPLLATGRVKAWFWGHEHKCVVYDGPHEGVDHARCVGHGGVPVRAVQPPERDIPEVDWFEDGERDHWAFFGFAILDFDGPQVTVRYIDENGDLGHEETFSA